MKTLILSFLILLIFGIPYLSSMNQYVIKIAMTNNFYDKNNVQTFPTDFNLSFHSGFNYA